MPTKGVRSMFIREVAEREARVLDTLGFSRRDYDGTVLTLRRAGAGE